MIGQLLSSLVAGGGTGDDKGGDKGGGKGGSGPPGKNAGAGSLSIPMSSTATSSATSRAGSTNKHVNVNFSGKVFSGKAGDYEEYEPGGGYFRSRAPVNYTTIALIAAVAVVGVFAVKK